MGKPPYFRSINVKKSTANSSPELIQEVHADSILFSMPTIAGDALEYEIPSKVSFENAPVFHEDEWCQLQFFTTSRFEDITERLTAYKAFELENRTTSGWRDLYVRDIPQDSFKVSVHMLARLEGAKVQSAPILTTSSQPIGQVQNGFTIKFDDGMFLYGLEQKGSIISLAASVHSDEGNQILTNTFMAIDKIESLILVDWRNQMIILGGQDGKLGVWQP